jgi:hypothetical protein
MDSYIVQVYRREQAGEPARRAQDRVRLTGTVEGTDGARIAFRGIEELWQIIGQDPATPLDRDALHGQDCGIETTESSK